MIESHEREVPYPPCLQNIMTEKPFLAHKWTIAVKNDGSPLLRWDELGIPFYHIFCTRCGFNDPKKERFDVCH